MSTVISVENLSKAYRIGAKEEVPDTLMGSLSSVLRSPLKNFSNLKKLSAIREGNQDEDVLWALKDVSFEVKKGEVLGVIGRNGAGKSTLLKILSRITEPTSGRVVIHGRVSSLLEVGTGFHPELSGRDNIYMNGTILGMTKREIDRKFDEIVDFSGVEKFLDTPTKRYSSGMQVRLAFAVAAHLEPEILIIDEVLAVGDGEFQKKCIGKMKDVANSGRTVVFVSHDMAAVESLCTVGVIVQDGQTGDVMRGHDAVEFYSRQKITSLSGGGTLQCHPNRSKNSVPLMKSVRFLANGNENTASLPMGNELSVIVDFENAAQSFFPVLGIVVKTNRGHALFGVNNRFINGSSFSARVTEGSIRCDLGSVPLVPGTYSISLYLGDEYRDVDVIEDALDFEVEATDYYGTGKLAPVQAGPIRWTASWSL